MEQAGDLSATQAKTVLADLVEAGGGDPKAAAAARGFEQLETGELDAVLDDVIAANPDEWGRYCEGDEKLAGFFTGKVMAATKGQADGKAVNQGLRSRRG
jgi:aspartyl-tRNA(Asn)/glutamyl-tRNA(Gln) amidotransferase subunit B